MRSTVNAFRALDLRCHALLRDAPLHDVWTMALRGGGPGRTMRDVFAIATPRAARPPAVRALLALRGALGRLFRLDAPRPDVADVSYVRRLSDDDRARSLFAPGTMRGSFRVLYEFADEAVYELRNATVHAFLAQALRPSGDGYKIGRAHV